MSLPSPNLSGANIILHELSGSPAAELPRKEDLRAHLLTTLEPLISHQQADIRERFMLTQNGRENLRLTSAFIDSLLSGIVRYLHPKHVTGIVVCAAGGYGRQELAPHSDIDLLFLYDARQKSIAAELSETILYTLWDLGFKASHSLLTLKESLTLAREDMTARTTMLDARLIEGDKTLYQEVQRRFWKEIVHGSEPEFIEAKLEERDTRHRRIGDSRYVLEPNIKEGKGALRDLHTLYWIARYAYGVPKVSGLVKLGILTKSEHRMFLRAQRVLWTIRAHLHYIAERPEEHLTFDRQLEISKRMGYEDKRGMRGVERFMKHYFTVCRHVGNLTRIFCARLETTQKRRLSTSLRLFPLGTRKVEGFRLENNWLTLRSSSEVKKDPLIFLRLFRVAQQHGLDIHPDALQIISRNLRLIDDKLRKNPEANQLFMDMLTADKIPGITLRRMNEAGVLGKFIPEFGRIECQMQYNMYHVHTVDEHTIHAITILHDIEVGKHADDLPLSTRLFREGPSKHILYLSLFLHDIAKGRPEDHSIAGEKIARKMGKRMGLSDSATDTVAWLVRQHLLFSHVAFRRDINDPETLRSFVEEIQSPERLRLLLLLTVADIMAVGPSVWNGWKGALLRELFLRAEEIMIGGDMDSARARRISLLHDTLRAQLADWPLDEVENYLADGFPAFWLSFDAAEHARIARLCQALPKQPVPYLLDFQADEFRDVTVMTFCGTDQTRLFTRLSGALMLENVSIAHAKIFTLQSGRVIDVLWLQNTEDHAIRGAQKLLRVRARIDAVLEGDIDPSETLASRQSPYPSRTDVFTVPPRVVIDNTLSTHHTVIEISGRDQSGFLYTVTSVLAQHRLAIRSAHISTYGERAVDVFYVTNQAGQKILSDTERQTLRDDLHSVLSIHGINPS